MQPPHSHAARRVFLGVACALLAVAAASAQSGRRQPKPVEIAPVPTPTPEATPEKKAQVAEDLTHLLVVTDRVYRWNMPPETNDIVYGVMLRRLRESKSLDPSAGPTDVTRFKAMQMARESESGHVVWLRVEPDSLDDNNRSARRVESYRIEFVVFEPGTAKTKTSGTAYARANTGILSGGINLPRCYPAALSGEAHLVRAALEAADRVIGSFGLAPPPPCS